MLQGLRYAHYTSVRWCNRAAIPMIPQVLLATTVNSVMTLPVRHHVMKILWVAIFHLSVRKINPPVTRNCATFLRSCDKSIAVQEIYLQKNMTRERNYFYKSLSTSLCPKDVLVHLQGIMPKLWNRQVSINPHCRNKTWELKITECCRRIDSLYSALAFAELHCDQQIRLIR